LIDLFVARRGSVSKIGCAALQKKRTLLRKERHRLSGCNGGGGKKKGDQTDV
jgi:hypothetical protein